MGLGTWVPEPRRKSEIEIKSERERDIFSRRIRVSVHLPPLCTEFLPISSKSSGGWRMRRMTMRSDLVGIVEYQKLIIHCLHNHSLPTDLRCLLYSIVAEKAGETPLHVRSTSSASTSSFVSIVNVQLAEQVQVQCLEYLIYLTSFIEKIWIRILICSFTMQRRFEI